MANPSLIRPAAGFIVYRLTDDPTRPEFLLLHSGRHGEWGFAKGHMEDGDADPFVTACRELREETGLSDVLVHSGFRARVRYRLPSAATKDVTYFLARAEGVRNIELSDEHNDMAWVSAPEGAMLIKHESLRELLGSAMSHILPNSVEKSGLL